MMVFGDPEYYNPSLGKQDMWAVGKVVYKILEVMQLPQECVQKYKGSLGTFFVENDVENKILNNKMVQQTIEQWNGKYKKLLGPPYDINEKRSARSEKNKSQYKALAVKQPILQAIMDGFKKCENRSKSIITLKGSQLQSRDFKDTLCRFCPNNNPMECHYILHIGVKRYNEWKAEEKSKMVNKKKNKETNKVKVKNSIPLEEKKSIRFKCNFPRCGSVFELRSELMRHNDRVHQYPKPFECKVCYRKFADRKLLKKHLKRHGTPQYHSYGSRRYFLKENDSSIKNLFNITETMIKEYESNENFLDKNSSVEIDIGGSNANEKEV